LQQLKLKGQTNRKKINNSQINHMKRLLILAICSFMFVHSYSQSDTTLPVKIELNLIKADTIINTNASPTYSFDVEISIKNTSQDSIVIWLMECSWWMNFLVNNDYIYIRRGSCDANSPLPIPFKGGESKMIKATLLRLIKGNDPEVLTTKLGLIITDSVILNSKLNLIPYDGTATDKSKWRIVWSNPLYISDKKSKFNLRKN